MKKKEIFLSNHGGTVVVVDNSMQWMDWLSMARTQMKTDGEDYPPMLARRKFMTGTAAIKSNHCRKKKFHKVEISNLEKWDELATHS